uniref:U3 small nucleolar RNA-associated protein 15 homolog n=1 Tax=Phallusia mammillata TaxID=59560 RepID=A0A6F9DXH9_9ASCI|nr:U3 small nucleolar RNA-associated protein 15 homolog [Phallusia mammillata]
MSSRFKTVDPLPTLPTTRKSLDDVQYWKGLQFPITIKEFGAVTDVAFQPAEPHYFAVTSSTRVELYDPNSNEVAKTFSRFHNVAYGASFRSDGKLLVAGNEDTQVRLFDVEGRVPLRIFKGHTRPVHVTKFCNDMKHIFSASDDKTVRVWDVATEQTLHQFEGHNDYIRSGCTSKTCENLIVTGSYDHTVKMFDTRSDECSLSVNHGCPVESVLMFPSGSVLLSAGGSSIKVWDVLSGGKLLATVSHHHKTVTCMTFNHDYTRLLSGGLDRHVKVYDVANYQVVHNIDYPGPILSMAISNEDKTLVVGMADKMLSIRHRKQACKTDDLLADENELSRKKRRQRSVFMQGQKFVPNPTDIVVMHKHKEQLEKYDHYFRKFEHSKALDAALVARVYSNTPEVTVAVMQELIRRDTIRAALAGRDEKKLLVLMKFLCRYITKISFAPILLDVAEMVIDIYSDTLDEATLVVQNMFQRLRDIIRREARLQRDMNKLMGCMETILTASNIANKSTVTPDPIVPKAANQINAFS